MCKNVFYYLFKHSWKILCFIKWKILLRFLFVPLAGIKYGNGFFDNIRFRFFFFFWREKNYLHNSCGAFKMENLTCFMLLSIWFIHRHRFSFPIYLHFYDRIFLNLSADFSTWFCCFCSTVGLPFAYLPNFKGS